MRIDDIIVIDTETSLHNDKVGKFKASPHCKDNWIVYFGATVVDPKTFTCGKAHVLGNKDGKTTLSAPTRHTILVGHNIGYDLLFLANPSNPGAQTWRDWMMQDHAVIWDTQLAHYRLTGQTEISPSLDKVAEYHGLPLKPNGIKDYWKQGISTEDIPSSEIVPYLEHDVSVTAQVFKQQILAAKMHGMLDMLRAEMQSRLTTIVMEHNGMHFDDAMAKDTLVNVITPLREQNERDAVKAAMQLTGLPEAACKPASPQFLSAVLYGGSAKWREQKPMMDSNGEPITFKTGKRKGEIKQKWYDMEVPVRSFAPRTFKAGTDAKQLETIMDACNDPLLVQFLDKVLAFRDAQKQEKTYFKGYSDLTWEDGMIHPNLNHAITATGRLSCTNPNLQNAGHSPIRGCFKSRFAGGHLMEVDLSQIEVVVQAFLSGDDNMKQDIRDGVDFHCKRAAFAKGESYEDVLQWAKVDEDPKWVKIRKQSKIVSFQKAYGAGPKKISDTVGISMREVKQFMEAEDRAYPNVPKTQEEWIKQVETSAHLFNGRVSGVLKSPIGVQYRFNQEEFNGHKTFKPTCIKNYPIQGFSADILKFILAGLRWVIREFNRQEQPAGEPPVLIVNTVHDSVIFDVPAWVDLPQLGRRLKHYFVTEPISVLKNDYGLDFDAPISADVDVGTNWLDMKPLH